MGKSREEIARDFQMRTQGVDFRIGQIRALLRMDPRQTTEALFVRAAWKLNLIRF